LSVIVPLSGLAKVRRAKVPLPLVSALQDNPEYSAELKTGRPRRFAFFAMNAPRIGGQPYRS
jgi:hypothetical protein